MWEMWKVCWKMLGSCNVAMEKAKIGAEMMQKTAYCTHRKVVRKFFEGIE